MEIQDYINLCWTRLAQIDSILERMKKDKIPKSVSVWGVLAEKKHLWLSRIEAVSQADPGNWYQFTGDDYFLN